MKYPQVLTDAELCDALAPYANMNCFDLGFMMRVCLPEYRLIEQAVLKKQAANLEKAIKTVRGEVK